MMRKGSFLPLMRLLERQYRQESKGLIMRKCLLIFAGIVLFLACGTKTAVATQGGSCSMGSANLSKIWYFAEGYTGEGFDEYLCMINPQTDSAVAQITYLFPDGSKQEQTVSLRPLSRSTIAVKEVVGKDKQVSSKVEAGLKIAVERATYFVYQDKISGGDCVLGANAPATTWYFAEGYTGSGFDEWICILNPGDSQANLTFAFQTQEEGEKTINGLAVAPHSRGSFKANDLLGGASYQTSLKLTSDQPIVAERPMYFDYSGTANWHWNGGHCVMGTPSLSNSYYFAEGTTRSGFEEWFTIQNPNTNPITINGSYQVGAGQGFATDKEYPVGANSRLTIFVRNEVGSEKDVSAHFISNDLFLVERPEYFQFQCGSFSPTTGGHCVVGARSTSDIWYFAEGMSEVGPYGLPDNANPPYYGYLEWLVLGNPGDTDALIEITFYSQSPAIPEETASVKVPPKTRSTGLISRDFGVRVVGPNSCVVRVISGSQVVAERPMYFNTKQL